MLHEFKNQLSASQDTGSPPYVIRASDLDKNFKICSVIETSGPDNAYRVVRPAGPDGPYQLVGQKTFDVCENGKPVKYVFFANRVASN